MTKRTKFVEERLRRALNMNVTSAEDEQCDPAERERMGEERGTPTPNALDPYGSVHSKVRDNGDGSVASPLLGPSLHRLPVDKRRGSAGSGRLVGSSTSIEMSEKDNGGKFGRDRGDVPVGRGAEVDEKERSSNSSTPRVVIEIDDEMEVPVIEGAIGTQSSRLSVEYAPEKRP